MEDIIFTVAQTSNSFMVALLSKETKKSVFLALYKMDIHRNDDMAFANWWISPPFAFNHDGATPSAETTAFEFLEQRLIDDLQFGYEVVNAESDQARPILVTLEGLDKDGFISATSLADSAHLLLPTYYLNGTAIVQGFGSEETAKCFLATALQLEFYQYDDSIRNTLGFFGHFADQEFVDSISADKKATVWGSW